MFKNLLILSILLATFQSYAGVSRISAMQKNSDGNFDVLCEDQSYEEATVAKILGDDVCALPVILRGKFTAVSGHTSYYDQIIVPRFQNRDLVGVTMIWLNGSNTRVELTCSNNVCTGEYDFGITFTVVDANHYVYNGSSSDATFRWVEDATIPETTSVTGSDM